MNERQLRKIIREEISRIHINRKLIKEAARFPISNVAYEVIPSASFLANKRGKVMSRSDYGRWETAVDDLMKVLNDFYKRHRIPWQFYKSNLKPPLPIDKEYGSEWDEDD
jgi:hypothetical protein